MGPKLLFFFGILVTHGAVGAALLGPESPLSSVSVTSCVQSPTPLPYFGQQRELLALLVVPVEDRSRGDAAVNAVAATMEGVTASRIFDALRAREAHA